MIKPVMTEQELYTKLGYTDHSREKRSKMAAVILDDPRLIPLLLSIISRVNDPNSCRASWVLESVIRKDLTLLYPNLDHFTLLLEKVRLESAIRPMAKICELLIISFYARTANETQQYVNREQLKRITAACFDWLIGNHKVAAQAYSMTTLLLLGKTFGWIHPELKIILEQNYVTGSAAYKARARMTLKKISVN